MSGLLRMVDDILAEPASEAAIDAVRAEGRGIGYTCSFVPEPLLSVRGLVPVRLRGTQVPGTPMADTYLSSVLCPYVRAVLESALDDALPHVDGWVLTSGCDAMRRLHDNLCYLAEPPFARILDVPHKRGDTAVAWFERELSELADAISQHFEVDVGEAALREAIARTNEFRALMRRLSSLRKQDPPPITGEEYHRIVVAASTVPKSQLLASLRAFLEERAHATPDSVPRARLLVVGSQLDDPRYLGAIESTGACVVADRFCSGSLPGLEPIEPRGGALHTLAWHTLNTTACPRMMDDGARRVVDLLALATEFSADGIVLATMKFCDLWGVESASLVRALRDAGIPILRLEREYALGGEGQLKTRAQAFLESMDR